MLLAFRVLFFNLMTLGLIAQNQVTNTIVCELDGIIPDSIQFSLNRINKKKEKIDFLQLKIGKLRHSDPQLAFLLAREGERQSKSSGWEQQRAQFLLWQAVICSFLNTAGDQNYQQLEWAKIASEIFKRKKNAQDYVNALSWVGQIAYNLNDFEYAYDINKEAATLVANLEDSKLKHQILGNIQRLQGNLAYMSDSSEQIVLQAYTKSRENYEKAGDDFGLGVIYEALAIIYTKYKKNDIEGIVSYYEKAIEQFKKIKNSSSLAGSYLELSTYYSKLYLDSKEVEWFNSANNYLRVLTKTPAPDQCERFYELGSNYQTRAVQLFDSLNMYSPELLDSALLAFSNGLKLVDKEVNKKCLEDLVRGASAICPYIDKNKCTQLFRLVDSTHRNILLANEEILKSAKKESDNYQKELSKSKQRQIFIVSALIIFVLLILFGALFAQQRWRNVKATLDMRMKALRARMNPHFISNCLNAIDSLVNQNRNDEASKYLIDFDRLCRQILDNSNEELIPLREELDTLANFISLEKLRLDDNLTYYLKVDEHVNQDEVHIPSMLLQPFVENAIWHGIQKKQAPGILKVEIKQKEGKYLECMVEDDGIGREKARQMEENSVLDRQSWGLSITEERIKALKNISGSELDIIDLYDDKGEARGTRVHILLPVLKNKALHDEGNHS
ncbi:MAG: histidine kinase [Saprospiraceae bacterium]